MDEIKPTKTMRNPKFIISLLILILLSGCLSPAAKIAKHLRQSEKHRLKAVALGAPVDTLRKTLVRDSVEFTGAKSSGETKATPNLDSLLEYCRQILASSVDNEKLNKSGINDKKPQNNPIRTVLKIQREVCPQKTIDLRDSVTLELQGTKYRIPFRLFIEAKNGTLRHEFKIDDLNAAYTKTVIETEMRSGDSWLLNFGQTLVAFIAGLVIGAIACKMFWK